MPHKHVFLIGLTDSDLARLKSIRNAERYVFYGVLDPDEILETYDFPVKDMLARAEAQLRRWETESGKTIDGIGAYLDFPVSTMLPLLCARLGKRGPTLESLLKCEHKYWGRLVQKEVIPQHIPRFQVFDPFDDSAWENIGLKEPFWIKPIKACGSMLGFYIENQKQFEEAIVQVRSQIHLISEPFTYILQQAKLPESITDVESHFFLAESIINGWQCTLEGYVLDGDIQPLGFVDSLRYENGISFFRYEYPSVLPDAVQGQMVAIAKTVIAHTGLDNCAFNIEFFWNLEQDRIWLLEINPRVSQSHSDIFEKVDGQSNQQATVRVACGEKPDFPRRKGQFSCAAKFFWRIFSGDARVTRVPTDEEIKRVEKRYPGTVVHPQIKEGMKLSDLLEQDSYSYAICHLFIGGRDRKALLDTYVRCTEMLPFEFAPI
ncbi:MAG: ATP-grasp domain-containing protein [Desulfobacterales bacterium]|nr:ATP-grasp domain-containing protein [Desulfobacterales bacterium]